MTTIYLIRHSKPLKVNNDYSIDSLQVQNEKNSLSIEGEELAKEKFNNHEFNDIDILFSSSYVRAIQTAKYLADINNLEINVVSDLGERKFGINSWEELPEGFERKQFLDEEYKLGDGESQREVRDRMYSTLMKLISENKDKRIAIVSHATAISYLLIVRVPYYTPNRYFFVHLPLQMLHHSTPDTFLLSIHDHLYVHHYPQYEYLHTHNSYNVAP